MIARIFDLGSCTLWQSIEVRRTLAQHSLVESMAEWTLPLTDRSLNFILTNSAKDNLLAFVGKLRGALSRIIRPGRRVHYVNFDEPLSFPANQMENADHVNHEAAEVYSRELGRMILEAKDTDPKREDEKKKADEPEPEQDQGEAPPGDDDARHDDDAVDPR